MTLSVIIPVFNGAAFIQKSYNQIIGQGIEDLELLYVDNNSSDDSASHIKALMKTDRRILYLKQPKPGAAATRNMGIEKAEGKYLYVFDVDDEIFPNALHRMINVLETHQNVDAVFGKMVKSYKSIDGIEIPNDETHNVIFKEKPYWGLLWFSSLKHVVGPPAFLYRKSVFDKIGYYNVDLHLGEDTALDITLGMLCNIAFMDSYVYLYFKHENSTIQTSKRQMERAFMIWPRLVKVHLPFYLDHKVPLKFKQLLYSQLFQSMGRQLYFTEKLRERYQLKKQLVLDIHSIKLPFLIQFFLWILVFCPWSIIRKFYGYYMVPYVIKRLKL